MGLVFVTPNFTTFHLF